MEFHVVIPVLISFAISLVLGPIVIPFLRRLKMGQTERELGVQSHLKKNGTPTMGGVIFLIATTVTSLFYIRDYPMIIPVLFLTLGFGLIGFLDDYLKVVLKRSDGLLPWQKMALQIVVTAVFAFYLVNYSNVSLTMKIPFWSGHYLNLGWFAVPVLFFEVIGTVNGVNFTDGLDGLPTTAQVIGSTPLFIPRETTVKNTATIRVTLEASPSSPSVKLTPFTVPITAKNSTGTANHPRFR